MLSLASIVTSLLLARAVAATPAPRAACNPTELSDAGVSIGSGNLEVVYSSDAAGAAIVSQALNTAVEWLMVTSPVPNGGFTLSVINQPGHDTPLFLSDVNGVAQLEPRVAEGDRTQSWGFVCSSCNDIPLPVPNGFLAASGCNIVSAFSGMCLQIGAAPGDPVTIVNCEDLGSGPQYFDVFVN